MAKKKAKKAKAGRRRRPNKKLWASAEARRVLSAEGELTMDSLKLIVENQREINTKIYRALKLIAQTQKAGAGSSKIASEANKLFELAEAIPGPGFPGCSD